MLSHHQFFARSTLLQSLELGKDGSAAIVQQQDAKAAIEILIPESILIVEETQVAQYAEYLLLALGIRMMILRKIDRQACCRRQRALNTIYTPIAMHILAGIDASQTNSHAIAIKETALTSIIQ